MEWIQSFPVEAEMELLQNQEWLEIYVRLHLFVQTKNDFIHCCNLEVDRLQLRTKVSPKGEWVRGEEWVGLKEAGSMDRQRKIGTNHCPTDRQWGRVNHLADLLNGA